MKRYGNLFEKVVSLDNLRLADESARKGKRHTKGVLLHDEHREENLIALHDALLAGTYKTSKYTHFTIYEPKEREVYRLPYYPDRIVHHAIMNVLEPIWVKTFTYNTYSCIKGRGVHACADRVRKIIRSFKGRPLYCLKIDIKKFYPSIDHDILKSIIRKKIKDQHLLQLLDEIICSADGLPIGNYLSQYFSNLMLCYLMHWVNEEQHVEATEYADDIVFFADNKPRLHALLAAVHCQLALLGLRLKENYQIFPLAISVRDRAGRALDYVGFVFYRQMLRIRKRIKQNLCRAVARLNRRHTTLKTYRMALSAWLGWAKYSNSKHLLQKILNTEYYDFIFNKTAACA